MPTEAELRIAQAQLVGWLEGLFHGIQTALFAQQMAAQAQLEQMRRAPSAGPAAEAPGDSGRGPATSAASTSDPPLATDRGCRNQPVTTHDVRPGDWDGTRRRARTRLAA